MDMSTAHIFYIPITFFVGVFAGFFLGRRSAEAEARELQKRRKRRQALRNRAGASDSADGGESDNAKTAS